VKEVATAGGADAAIVSNHWAEGGAGARELAAAVIACCETPSDFKFLYDLALPIEEKITTICKEIYGADGIDLSDLARTQIDTYTRQGFSGLPSESRVPSGPPFPAPLSTFIPSRLVCMAKTQYSFSHDASLKGVPTGQC